MFAQRRVDPSQDAARLEHAGVDLECAREFGARRGPLSLHGQRSTEDEVRLGVVRIDLERSAHTFDRLVDLLLGEVDLRHHHQRAGARGSSSQHLFDHLLAALDLLWSPSL